MNDPSLTIEKKQPDLEGLDFEGLKSEGIRMLQEVCGKTWTDYNFHDPGVTILEQLCYALTDLKYRTEFDTADYLTGPDGTIDLERQALFPPEAIYPCRPTTANDYRKVLIDAIPEIDGVWVKPVGDDRTQGLYRIFVKLNESTIATDQAGKVLGRVREVYTANRNLCEDIKEVRIVKDRYYALRGAVELNGKRDPVDILAEIYFKCARFISPAIKFQLYEKALREGLHPENIFKGPLTRHGFIAEDALDQTREVVTLSELIGIVREIEGVKYVADLWFEAEKDQLKTASIAYESALSEVPSIKFPKEGDPAIALYKNGRNYRVSLKAVRVAFERLNADYASLRQKRQNFAELYPPPKGEVRDLQQYYSIQNNFPGIYGIDANGLPDSAPPRRKAQAGQLKAYLLVFEQIMANFLANLQNLSRFFSTDEKLRQSSFHQWLSNQYIPNIEYFYQDDAAETDRQIAAITRRFDKFGDRRNRVLDYLLALYGESFTQNSLRHFNCYHSEAEQEYELIRNKIRFLKHLVNISQNRGGAFDYCKDAWQAENTPGLKIKLGILLGLQDLENRPLADVFDRRQLSPAPDDQLHKVLDLEYPDEDIVAQKFKKIPWLENTATDGERLFNQIVYLRNGLISQAVLRGGIFLDNYRVGRSAAEGPYELVFRPRDDQHWYGVATSATEAEAIELANCLRRYLIRLNRAAEGFHVLEHVLLRPMGRGTHQIVVPDDFYSFRISVVFPAWTARFNDAEFRKLAQETVLINCPAHVLPEFHWLAPDRMKEFETLYRQWLTAKTAADGTEDTLDDCSQKLISFLLEQDGSRDATAA